MWQVRDLDPVSMSGRAGDLGTASRFQLRHSCRAPLLSEISVGHQARVPGCYGFLNRDTISTRADETLEVLTNPGRRYVTQGDRCGPATRCLKETPFGLMREL